MLTLSRYNVYHGGCFDHTCASPKKIQLIANQAEHHGDSEPHGSSTSPVVLTGGLLGSRALQDEGLHFSSAVIDHQLFSSANHLAAVLKYDSLCASGHPSTSPSPPSLHRSSASSFHQSAESSASITSVWTPLQILHVESKRLSDFLIRLNHRLSLKTTIHYSNYSLTEIQTLVILTGVL